jgi:hypothetical protein
LHSHPRGRHSGRERGFLETVLGAPKAAINQEPYVNTGLLQRQKRLAPEPDVNFSSQIDSEDIDEADEEDTLSPSHQLDLSPRIMMRGRETKTRYSGSGIYANLIAQVRSSTKSFLCKRKSIPPSKPLVLIVNSFPISGPLLKRSG